MRSYIQKHRKDFDCKKFVALALQEDVGDGDHTTLATLKKKKEGRMKLLVKQEGILAGVEAAKMVFGCIDPKIKFKEKIRDGARVKKGDIAFTLSGPTAKLLTAERLVLNIIQRMSGIATYTNYLQSFCKGTNTKVIDTRKTTPLFRFFEKWAVVIGGGANHRYALYDMILVKDNHIDFAGGITQAIDAVHDYLEKNKLRLKVEVECRSLQDVQQVLRHGGVDRIMLDNFSPLLVKQAVKLINDKYETEASGGITEKNIRAYAIAGVDFISVGALTHQVKSLDLSLKVA